MGQRTRRRDEEWGDSLEGSTSGGQRQAFKNMPKNSKQGFHPFRIIFISRKRTAVSSGNQNSYSFSISVLPRHCVVLLTGEGDKFADAYEAFLTFAVANTKDTLRFAHIYNDRQPEFADALLMDEEKYRGKSAVSITFLFFCCCFLSVIVNLIVLCRPL